MDFLAQIGLFFLQAITIVIAILVLVAGILSMRRKPQAEIEIISLSNQYQDTKKQMLRGVLRTKEKKQPKNKNKKPTLFILDFIGDIKASAVEQLRDEISAILSIAKNKDAILLRLESPGGTVNGYGLAASQLQRIRDKGIPLTVCIDKVAASGGYLMACVANEIIAAPFAIIGSIGVVAQMPNFNRFLKKHAIDFEMVTAGDYKRTLTVFGENSEKGRQKFKEDLELIHKRFSEYVLLHRSQVDIDKVTTGEHWLAHDAFQLKLVDNLKTSDDYILDRIDSFQIYKIAIEAPKSLTAKLIKQVAKLTHPWA